MHPALLLLCLFGVTGTLRVHAATVVRQELLDAIRHVESGGDECAKGDNGKSLGAYQIMMGYYNDAVEFDPGLTADGSKLH